MYAPSLDACLSLQQEVLEKRIQELEQLNQGLIQHARLRRGVNKRKGGTVEVDMTLEEESTDDIKAPPFPLHRLLVYLGFGLLIASIMSVAIVVGITQSALSNYNGCMYGN